VLAVWADREKLAQVLLNLLSNAVKFTEPGGPSRSPRTRAERTRCAWWCATPGIGVPADKLDAIFDPFVQARQGLTRAHEGTGLGLAISREFARGMGGELAVDSREGAGSTFSLTCAAPATPTATPPTAARTTSAARPSGARPNGGTPPTAAPPARRPTTPRGPRSATGPVRSPVRSARPARSPDRAERTTGRESAPRPVVGYLPAAAARRGPCRISAPARTRRSRSRP
jgi:hypothetical protein